MHGEKNQFDSSYKYNPMDPRNWRLFCAINILTSILLVIDWLLGITFSEDPISFSFLARTFTENEIFLKTLPLIIALTILSLSPFLNEQIDGAPFFGAITIKFLLYLGSCQYTIVGRIGETVLDTSCTVLIVWVFVYMTILELPNPLNYVQAFLIGFCFLIMHLITNILLFGWMVDETWGLIFVLTSLGGLFLIYKDKLLVGALIIFVMTILNDYILPYTLSGYDVGQEILTFLSLLLIIHSFLNLSEL